MSPLRRPAAVATVAVLLSAALVGGPSAVGAGQGGGRGGGKAVFDSTSYVSGAGAVAVHGKAPRKRKVRLQLKTRGGAWQTLASTRSSGKGAYAVAHPLTWYGVHAVRVAVGGRGGFTKATKVTVDPGYVPVGDAADTTLLTPLSSPRDIQRFDPCSTVDYQVNVAEVGPAYLPLFQQAMAQVSAATGIAVRYRGETSMVPFLGSEPYAQQLPKGIDLVLAFGNNSEVQQFARGEADGVGGPRSLRQGRSVKGRAVAEILQAGVTLQTEGLVNYTPSFTSTGKPGIGNLMLHEIGHAFGLDHSQRGDEMMIGGPWVPDADGVFRSRYAAGDLAGLAKVGLGAGCVRTARGSGRTEVAPAPRP